MPTWSADLVVDEALAASLVGRFPEPAGRPLRLLSKGWDRTVWLADERWVFGFPRRAVVVPGLERELVWLPRIAPQLPAPIPLPTFVGEPAEEFPWPFFGGPFLPGAEALEAELDEAERTAVGVELARFLRVLHALDGTSLPPDGNNRADMSHRAPLTRDLLAQVGLDAPAILAEAELLPPAPEPTTVAHGDLHARQVLVHEGRLSGVIDWVDLCRGDPSLDLMMLWSFVPPAGRGAFLAAYGDVGEPALLRARVIALMIGAVLVLYARDEKNSHLERAALQSIELALTD